MIKISKRPKKTEKKSEDLLKGLFSSLFNDPDAIVVKTDNYGRVINLNVTAQRFFRFSLFEVHGKPFVGTLIPLNQKSKIPFPLISRRIKSSPSEFITEIMKKDGEKGLVSWSHFSLNNNLGDKSGLLYIGYDITNFKDICKPHEIGRNFSWSIFDDIQVLFVVIDKKGKIIFANRKVCDLTGYSANELRSKDISDILFPMQKWIDNLKEPFSNDKCYFSMEYPSKTKYGEEKFISWTISEIKDSDDIKCFVATGIDVTFQKKLEEQLRHAQKMEAVGRLAGGIAHDFNNILTGITNYTQLALKRISLKDPVYPLLKEIDILLEKASAITSQLLALSKKVPFSPKPLNVNNLIKQLLNFLRRILGERIEIIFEQTEDLRMIMADSSQIEQVLMNLCVNAKDAMPEGGILKISTENIFIDKNNCFNKLTKPGYYVCISISDTGIGMEKSMIKKIFEPFFTTKGEGGTGLGLSIVYGIVSSHGGFIDVKTSPKKGTTFKIYFPVTDFKEKKEKIVKEEIPIGGNEMILVAEDEDVVRDSAIQILEEYGYKVIGAKDGEEALDLFFKYKDSIKLLFLDTVMPKKGGKEVFDELKRDYPLVKFLFTSGYNIDEIRSSAFPETDIYFIQKPYGVTKLVKKVREILDSP